MQKSPFMKKVYKPTGGLSQILPSDWLSYSPSIGDRPLVAKKINFQIQRQIQNYGRKLTFSRGFSSFLQNNILSD